MLNYVTAVISNSSMATASLISYLIVGLEESATAVESLTLPQSSLDCFEITQSTKYSK